MTTFQEESDFKGSIRPSWYAHCACGHSEYIDFMHDTPTKGAKAMGWKLHPKYGWMCPDCVKTHGWLKSIEKGDY